jgi:hypothetical protein
MNRPTLLRHPRDGGGLSALRWTLDNPNLDPCLRRDDGFSSQGAL